MAFWSSFSLMEVGVYFHKRKGLDYGLCNLDRRLLEESSLLQGLEFLTTEKSQPHQGSIIVLSGYINFS